MANKVTLTALDGSTVEFYDEINESDNWEFVNGIYYHNRCCYDRESKIELDIRFNNIKRIIAKEPVKKYSQLEIHLFNEEVITIDKVWHPNELVEIFKMIKNNNYKL